MQDETISKKVLLVDDDVIALTAHRLPLVQLGFVVDEAKSGQEALDKVAKNLGQYDLVLMDYNLPDFNGGVVTQKIRCLEEHSQKRLPIIGITAHIDENVRQLCLSAGMDDVLSKPVLPDKINALLNKYNK